MEYLAHVRTMEDGSTREQTAAEHCRSTAKYASDCLSTAGIGAAGELAGLLHDLGKFTDVFHDYLRAASRGEAAARGSVIHTFQGCRLLLEQFHAETPDRYEDITSELLAWAVGAHHGLFDCVDGHRKSGFAHRMKEEQDHYEEALSNFTGQCAGMDEIRALFERANRELSAVYDQIWLLSTGDDPQREPDQEAEEKVQSELMFYLGLLARLILSAVIEGDRRDTAEFMTDAVFPEPAEDMRDFWGQRLSYMEGKLAGFAGRTQIDRARRSISDQCREFAEQPGGVYRLHVPTGAGKTLSGVRFALAHARKWKKRRIIFTVPLLSILEQNAKVIRDFIGDDGVILEHHSNVIRTAEEADALDRRELLTENWCAPVIITTLVQFLNTLFDGRTTAIRRFQALSDSVIILDEVQTVPNRMLTLFNLAVNFLTRICRATVILCSATQPCLGQTQHPLRGSLADIVPYREELWSAFERTRLIDAGGLKLAEIPGFVEDAASESGSLLVICNKKQEAEYLFRELSGVYGNAPDPAQEASEAADGKIWLFHLSASMCMQHRRDTLERLERALGQSRQGVGRVICISTQVVEAGVDLSFERVIRFAAGMDSVIQAAGRCNRNGEYAGLASVYILRCLDEALGMLRDIRDAKTAALDLLEAYKQSPGHFSDRLSSDEAIEYFYRRLYQMMPEEYQDDQIPACGTTLFSLLSVNERFADEDCECAGRYCLNQSFRMAGNSFTVFDEDTEDVVVPYGEGERLIEELCGHDDDLAFLAGWLNRAKPYTVSLYRHQRRQLEPDGLFLKSGVAVLRPGFYDEQTGLRTVQDRLDYLEV